MTVPRVLEMGEYWRIHPPLQELFTAFVGYTPAAPTQHESIDAEELIHDLMGAGFGFEPGLLG